ncbi:MAG: cytochrome c [Saprospiraceae bacterium]|nr:cytochrome c [Saprospiraceae bacterium]
MKIKYSFRFAALVLGVLYLNACSPAEGNSPGHEYMPDMGHAISYEPNRIDEYSLHTWDKQSVRTVNDLWGKPKEPVKGTIARGAVGISYNPDDSYMMMMKGVGDRGIYTPINGSVPYYYADTEEERVRAMSEIVANPFPITAKGIERGKELWITYCGICHGEKCAGNGYLISEDNPNAKYPAQPANLLLDTFVNGTNGRLYHAIMYGKNVMGGYPDKLSYEERWQVVHYIRACQAEEKKLEYNANRNTLNVKSGMPDSLFRAVAKMKTEKLPALSKPKGTETSSVGNITSDKIR